jgi:hypothetical protein
VSDFLVNLARRSAGLAPVVRARWTPAVDLDDAAGATEAPASRAEAERGEVRVPAAAPSPQASATSHGAAVQQPAPVVHVAPQPSARVAQRTPATSPAPASAATPTPARGGDASIVAPLAPSRSVLDVPAAIVPASAAVATATHVAADSAPRTRERADEPRAIATRVETVVRHETSDAPAPTVVTIEPVERADSAATAARFEPTPERTVHVRIGAIEIFGDSASPPPAVAAASTAAPTAAPTSPPSGFDDFAALRSYRPWAW